MAICNSSMNDSILCLMLLMQAQALPKKTKGHLYYSNQEGLDASRNKVQSRPMIGKLIYSLCFTTNQMQDETAKDNCQTAM